MRKLMSFVALVLLFAACGERAEEEAVAAPSAATPAATSSASATPAAAAVTVTVRGADGADVATVEGSADSVVISYADKGEKHTLRGDLRDSGKRKYALDGSNVTYEVKPGDDDGFKLRTAGGQLLWKVKVTEEKIKISNNEQNDRPFELKAREGDRVKVVGPDGRELGNVRFDAAASLVEVENASGKKQFEIKSAASSAGYAVFLLDGVPQTHKVILLAELLKRGR